MKASLRGRLLGAYLVVILSLAACSPGDTHPAETTSSKPRPSHAEKPKNRDRLAVLAAMRQLDLCGVLTAAAGEGSNPPASKPVADDPFSCAIAGHPGGSVRIWELGVDSRSQLPVRAIGGAKAYVDFTVEDTCDVYLPIDFLMTLEFQVRRQGPGPTGCGDDVENFVAPAVAVLNTQAAIAAKPKWDACSALARMLNDTNLDPFHLLDAGLYSVGQACERWKPSLAHVEFAYRNPIIGEANTKTVEAVPVEVQLNDSTGKTVCWMSWRSGAADSPYASRPDEWIGVAASDCVEAEKLAKSAMAVAASPPPQIEPQQPLLYKPDEPDTPYPGACAHLDPDHAKQCAPFAEVPAPKGKTAVVRAAPGNGNLQCMIGRETITKHFGSQLIPVVVDNTCYFVEPERQLQVQFELRSDSLAGIEKLFNVTRVKIAGHPAYVDTASSYHVWVATSGNPKKGGTVELTVDGGPASRGAGPPTDAQAKVDLVVTDILKKYFS